MPRVSGNYTLPPGYRAVSGEIIRPSQHNPPLEDIAQALTDSLPRDGSAPMTGNLPMGGNNITGLINLTLGTVNAMSNSAAGVALTDVGRVEAQVASDAAPASVLFRGYVGTETRFRVGVDGVGHLGAGGVIPANRILTQGLLDAAGLVPEGRAIATGDGLTGGGNLSANRTLAVDGTVVRTSRRVDTGDGLTGGGNLQGDRTLSVDSTVVRTTRQLFAQGGLIGGGTLATNVGIGMGTPSDITRTSTNFATGTTHSHSLSGPSFRDMMANYVNPTTLGALVFAFNSGPDRTLGQTTDGVNLFPACESDGEKQVSPTPLAGTWQCCGLGNNDYITNWRRVS